jgi:hypothetical protein
MNEAIDIAPRGAEAGRAMTAPHITCAGRRKSHEVFYFIFSRRNPLKSLDPKKFMKTNKSK